MTAAKKLETPGFDPSLCKRQLDQVVANIQTVIRGKEEVIRQALACWLAGGHVLFEDVPGTGKTILARALALAVSMRTKRVQFTPDLLPSDIIGTSMFSREKNQFIFMPGPIFTGVLLADEINRATPRTQSALLQAMAEGQVSAENKTYALPESFFVIGTQNPVEQHGTFPLPEAQLDRFMMRLTMGYPSRKAEKEVVASQLLEHPIQSIKPTLSEGEWTEIRQSARQVNVTSAALEYAVNLVGASRDHPHVALGGSPRATIALIRCAQAVSLMAGEDFVKPDYIKALAIPVLEHRIALHTKARLDGLSAKDVVRDIVNRVAIPV